MSEEKNINVSPIPKSIDNLVQNTLTKPSECIGQTFEDIWEIVIGNRLHYKRKIQEATFNAKYEEKVKEFHKEIEIEAAKIPESKNVPPDFQTISIVLQDAEWSIDSENIRKMFAKLVAATMNEDVAERVHPIFGHILKHMNCNDAVVFEIIATGETKHLLEITRRKKIEFSIRVLLSLGLIVVGEKRKIRNPIYGDIPLYKSTLQYEEELNKLLHDKYLLEELLRSGFTLSEIGEELARICFN